MGVEYGGAWVQAAEVGGGRVEGKWKAWLGSCLA